jgi:hypothetical protein
MTNGTRRGWGVSVTPRPLFTPGKDPVPIVQKAGKVPGPVFTGAENLAPPGFDPRTVQPVAQSLCRLRYPAHLMRILTAPKHVLYQSWHCAILLCLSLISSCNDNASTSKVEWLTESDFKPYIICTEFCLKQCSKNLQSLNSLWLFSSSCVIFRRVCKIAKSHY